MKKLIVTVSLLMAIPAQAGIEEQLESICKLGKEITKVFAPQKICVYAIAGTATTAALKKLVDTPWKKDNTRELIQYSTYSLIGIGFLTWYTSRTQI